MAAGTGGAGPVGLPRVLGPVIVQMPVRVAMQRNVHRKMHGVMQVHRIG